METKRYKVRLNSNEKLEELVQEIYDQYCKSLNEIQNEMSKLMSSTNLAVEGFSMDDKAKYFKAMHDLTVDKKKALEGKTEVAKLLFEVIKHNGDANSTVSDQSFKKRTSLNLDDIRNAINGDGDGSITYELKKN